MPERDLRDVARALLERAREDALVLTQLASNPDAPDRPLGLHAQQAIEKALKATIAGTGTKYPYVHDLRQLAELVVRAGEQLPVEVDRIDALSAYALDLRYEAAPLEMPSLDREATVELVERVLSWAERSVAAPPGR